MGDVWEILRGDQGPAGRQGSAIRRRLEAGLGSPPPEMTEGRFQKKNYLSSRSSA